jgi:hypothetical protein
MARLIRYVGLLLLLATPLLTSCIIEARKEAPRVTSGEVVPKGFPSSVRIARDTQRTLEDGTAQVLPGVVAAAGDGKINILALSGGGAGAAFGAGALVGWSRVRTRPQFQIVTGVSAGALIAPLAFLGPDWDGELEEAFAGSQTKHLLKRRMGGVLFGSSIYRGEPLAALVDHYVTDRLIKAIAAEGAKGRLLLVATTNLDTEQTNIWNLTNIAAQGGEKARRLFRDVLIASASIPGAFPPVLIRVEDSSGGFDELHVDGGTTASFFIAPEIAGFLPGQIALLRGANLYVILNEQLSATPATTPIGTLAIIKRGIAAGLNSGARADLQIAVSLARQHGMSIEVTGIPAAYPFRGLLGLEPFAMKSLFEYGASCAAAGQLWGTPLGVLEASERISNASSGGTLQCPAAPYPLAPPMEASAALHDRAPNDDLAHEAP